MIKRTIEISSEGVYLSLKNGQMLVAKNGSAPTPIPVEDVGVLLIDTPGVTATSALLTALSENGAVTVFCGKGHHPEGLLLPNAGNALQTERLRAQIGCSQPLQKRLWAKIVRAKILNQRALLPETEPAFARLKHLADDLKSGDPENAEAQAARFYWEALFRNFRDEGGQPFRRERDGPPPNNLLNYGYMALRAATARAVVGAGLLPALGLQHHNRANPFCLADDLMEAFRPWVDRRVLALLENKKMEIDRDTKKELLAVLTDTVLSGADKGPLLVALQKSAASLANCFNEGAKEEAEEEGKKSSAPEIANRLLLPEWPRD